MTRVSLVLLASCERAVIIDAPAQRCESLLLDSRTEPHVRYGFTAQNGRPILLQTLTNAYAIFVPKDTIEHDGKRRLTYHTSEATYRIERLIGEFEAFCTLSVDAGAR